MSPSPDSRVEALWIKRAHRGPMDSAEEVVMLEDSGIEGNADRGGRRQVTLIEAEVFEELRAELSPAVDPAMRRANVLLRGIRLEGTRERLLAVGDALLRIRGETRPCERMDEALEGLRAGLDPGWRGGAYAQVEQGGRVRVGDPVRWIDGVGAGPT
jgi:MOSC domain-containing protein YiiM